MDLELYKYSVGQRAFTWSRKKIPLKLKVRTMTSLTLPYFLAFQNPDSWLNHRIVTDQNTCPKQM